MVNISQAFVRVYMKTLTSIIMIQTILSVLLLPCILYAKVTVQMVDTRKGKVSQTNENRDKISKGLLLPQYSDQELLDKEYNLRNDLKKLGKRPPEYRESGAKVGIGFSSLGILIGAYLMYADSTEPALSDLPISRPQTLGGLALILGSTALLGSSMYYYRKSARAYDRVYIPMKHEHDLTLKAVEQRNRGRQQQHIEDKTNRSQNSTNNLLKLKERELWSSHKKAWVSLGLSALMIGKGYTDYQSDPEKSKVPLYIGITLGASLLVTSAYFFHLAYKEYTDAKKSPSFNANDQSTLSNTWVAPSLIDRDWGLAMGFQF